jgi:hypothetical protein
LTSNVDAEYGVFSGGIINVIAKSGGNEIHGSLFEFLRNTDLDARGFFSPDRSAFQQNQFGGTVDGPIRKNKVFFFGDYQGQRTIQGLATGLVQVPSLANRAGNFSDAATTLTGQVNGDHLAQTLTNHLGCGVTNGEPYYAPNCTFRDQCVSERSDSAECVFCPGDKVVAEKAPRHLPTCNPISFEDQKCRQPRRSVHGRYLRRTVGA